MDIVYYFAAQDEMAPMLAALQHKTLAQSLDAMTRPAGGRFSFGPASLRGSNER
jgi:hypothetical protein